MGKNVNSGENVILVKNVDFGPKSEFFWEKSIWEKM